MRRKAFPGSRSDTHEFYQRAGNWLLATMQHNEKAAVWCQSNGVPLQKAAGETIGSSGAFVVPTEFANVILDIRDSYGAIRRRARIYPMASDNTHIARHIGGTTASFVGENATSSAFAATSMIDAIQLTARKITTLVQMSNELEEDAVVEMVDVVANEIGLAFAIKEDDCAFNGDGTSTYGNMYGITKIVLDGNHGKAKVTAASGHNTFATLDTADLGNLMASVRASAIPNAAWYCSQTAFAATFCRLAGTAGGGYLETRMVDGVETPCYLGFPVILTQKLPLSTSSLSGAAMMVFGDMYAGAVLGQRRGITLARSEDRYMDTDQIGIIGTERFHTVIHDLGDNSNFGSLAALVGG